MKKLFFVVKAPGLLSNPEDPTLLPLPDLARVSELENAGAIQGGLRPKIAAARSALDGGVKSIHIVSGVLSDAILAEVFTKGRAAILCAIDNLGKAWPARRCSR